jgi:hypothetical protein
MTIELGQRRAGLRGKLPARPGSIKLKFGDYLKESRLPALPAHFGHVTNVPPTRYGWQMLGNDVAGDCVIAGRCHQIMLEHMATHRPLPDFSPGSALSAYSACLVYAGNQPWNPRDPSTDKGLDMQTAAKWWRDVGLTDADGNVHKIDAYVAIENVDDVLMATYLCGSAGVGLALPDTAEQQFEAGQIWDDVKTKPTGGHYVPCVGYMGGHLVFVTWGHLQGATRAYIEARMEDGVCCLSREYMTASGLSPEMIDWAALLDDVDALASMKEAHESAHEQAAEHEVVEQEPEPEPEPAAEHVDEEPIEEVPDVPPVESAPPPHKPKHKPPKRSHKKKR